MRTGGPTIGLRRRGYTVTGVDLHEEVIELARAKASRFGLGIEFLGNYISYSVRNHSMP